MAPKSSNLAVAFVLCFALVWRMAAWKGQGTEPASPASGIPSSSSSLLAVNETLRVSLRDDCEDIEQKCDEDCKAKASSALSWSQRAKKALGMRKKETQEEEKECGRVCSAKKTECTKAEGVVGDDENTDGPDTADKGAQNIEPSADGGDGQGAAAESKAEDPTAEGHIEGDTEEERVVAVDENQDGSDTADVGAENNKFGEDGGAGQGAAAESKAEDPPAEGDIEGDIEAESVVADDENKDGSDTEDVGAENTKFGEDGGAGQGAAADLEAEADVACDKYKAWSDCMETRNKAADVACDNKTTTLAAWSDCTGKADRDNKRICDSCGCSCG